MQSKGLNVINLCITEEKGTFMLCGDERCININFEDFQEEQMMEIKNTFQLEEDTEEIRSIIMSKVIEALV